VECSQATARCFGLDGECGSPAPPASSAASIFNTKAHCEQSICATALWRKTVFFPAHVIAQIGVSAVETALGVAAGELKWQFGGLST
jgi:hypothetical protein